MKFIVSAILLAAFSTVLSCEKTQRHAQVEINTDTLFLGFSLGMKRQAFFDYCWEQNKKKLFTHGPTNQNVEYKLVNDLKTPVAMRFYPSFHDDRIYEMPVTFTYDRWAPWNREYWSDSLMQDLLPVFRKWYGDNFKKLEHPTMGTVYYKIDGKRRINLFCKDDQYVQAVFTDVKIEKKLKEAYAEKLKAESQKNQ